VIEEGKNGVMKKKEEVIGKKKVIRKRNDHGVGEELKNEWDECSSKHHSIGREL
jgi:hypothetical protein